ncbi:tetratricopeptide repeat-containing sensor histidine kinase [Tenacibaculum sp. M341]|uniref:tetratricopeptide repeat-containing sensor histidine kinase n=1 Tax=Tenacibaculum sp. M341 TaxID=2530339 RepID=UPI00104A1AFA|nr:histidine kinase [Tenacibaculum sp. M341]TCI85070.1 tetratricopeptide repeat protein [Tenacibaculum sp. M341]
MTILKSYFNFINIRYTYIFLFCFLIQKIKAQTENLQLIESYIKKSKELAPKAIDSSFYFSEKSIQLASQINNDTLLAKSLLQKSSLHILSNQLIKADSLLSLNLKKELPFHIKGQTIHNLGTIQYKKQEFEKALELYVEAAKTTEKSNNKKLLVNTYTNIGVINARLQNFKNAQKYLEKSLDLIQPDTPLRLQILTNLTNIYKQQKQFDLFEKNIFIAEKLALKFNSKRTLAVIYNNLSDYYTTHKTNIKKAVSYGKKSIALKKEQNHNANFALAYNNLGHAYLKNKQHQNAIMYLDSALPTAKGLLKSYVLNNLKDAYLGLDNYKKAMTFAELKDRYKDSLNNAQQKEKVTAITEKFESEKKEQQIQLLNSENKLKESKIQNQKGLLIAITSIVILLTAFTFLWFKHQKNKQSLQEASLKHKLFQTQLNPHFLFHSLNSIQSFIYLNKKEDSLNYISNYSKLMRSIFDNSSIDFITIEEDVDHMKAYLELQKVNFKNNVDFSIHADKEILNYKIPPMFIQPYIENAIQHGIKQLENGKVSVNYNNKPNSIEVIIFDNGKGFESKSNQQLLEKKSSSKVIEQRILNLQKTYNYEITHEVFSNTPNETKIKLTFPKKGTI